MQANFALRRYLPLLAALLLTLTACDRVAIPKFGSIRTYGDCLAARLSSAHTVESSAAIIGSCRLEFPPGNELRKRQVRLPTIQVYGRAGLDAPYGASRTFSGTLWNGSTDYVVTEVVIQVNLKPKDEAKSARDRDRLMWTYSLPLELQPRTADTFSFTIVPVTDAEFDWGVAEVYGVSVASLR